MRSGELARLAGVSTDTLRHYERIGVLPVPHRTPGGYREYPAQAVNRVTLVRSALSMGFSLAELTGVLKVRDQGGAPCRQVRTMAGQKLVQLEQQISELLALRNRLRTILKDWDRRLKKTPKGEKAALLESLKGHHEK